MADFPLSVTYWPLLLLGAYVLGSIPFAQVIARVNGVDLRQVGSGNVGAGNLTHEVGIGWGIFAGVLDGLKGLVSVWIARKAGLGLGAAGLVGIAAVIGHNWSIWLKGRSGRGLAPSVGLVLSLDPALLVWTSGWAVAGWRIGGGLAGFLGWGLLPIVAIAMNRPPTETVMLMLLTIVLMGRRIQGNSDHATGTGLRRAIYDTDRTADDFPDAVEDPLTP